MNISVAMCTFNGGAFIAEQLESIAKQTRPPDELIVSDDGSTDATVSQVEAFAATVPFAVRVLLNSKTLGINKNFESAIAACGGDVIALCDQDDVWRDDKLAVIEQKFAAEPDTALVFGDAELVDEALRPLNQKLSQRVGLDSRIKELISDGRAIDVLAEDNIVTGATAAFRSDFKSLILPIPEGALIHDGWSALLIASVSRVGFIDDCLIKYRQHEKQQLGAPQKSLRGMLATPTSDAGRYLSMASQLEAACDRLASQNSPGAARALSIIKTKITHLRTRATLPSSRMSRLPVVVTEIANGNYRRYSSGILSAVKDLALANPQ